MDVFEPGDGLDVLVLVLDDGEDWCGLVEVGQQVLALVAGGGKTPSFSVFPSDFLRFGGFDLEVTTNCDGLVLDLEVEVNIRFREAGRCSLNWYLVINLEVPAGPGGNVVQGDLSGLL